MSGPAMRRTTWTDLAGPFAVVAVLVYAFFRFRYDSVPPLRPFVPVPLVALAVLELVAARRVRAAVRHDPEAKAMAAIAIARCVALGKASSLVAAGVAGAAVGLIVRLLPDVGTVDAANATSVVALLVLLAAVALGAAGLWLERAGVDPGNGNRPEATRT